MKLWNKNFILVTIATALGSLGAIASSFALSYLVFDETKSTLASSLVICIQLIPYIILPLTISPIMDRMERKKFLVLGDVCNGVAYFLLAMYLLHFQFSYVAYLLMSLCLACISSIDELAYTSFYPLLIPNEEKEKGYAISTMLFPILKVVMMPISAVLLKYLGIPTLLLIQAICSLLAAFIENQISYTEKSRFNEESYSLMKWKEDLKEGYHYLKKEKGLFYTFGYSAITNALSIGYAPILIAFFSSTAGFDLTMYSFFSVAEFIGRTLASATQYQIKIPNNKKYPFVIIANIIYQIFDCILLFISYPLMLINRAICGYLGTNSAIIRTSSVQKYIPDHLRSRVNAFSNIMIDAGSSVFSLLMGYLGDYVDYRYCLVVAGVGSLIALFVLNIYPRKEVEKIYRYEPIESSKC